MRGTCEQDGIERFLADVRELLHVAGCKVHQYWKFGVWTCAAHCNAIVILLAEFCRGYRFLIALFFVLDLDTWRLAPDRASLMVREVSARRGGRLNRRWRAVMSVMGDWRRCVGSGQAVSDPVDVHFQLRLEVGRKRTGSIQVQSVGEPPFLYRTFHFHAVHLGVRHY